ncbi:MAG TPA: hypothetical protein VJV78_37880 [Polyangiales bacterium]|nr:hypothetical protein [Polyangiales bacterium]
MPRSHAVFIALALVAFQACDAVEPSAGVPSPDGQEFAREVYPVLLRDCGSTTACHGASQRPFRVVGPGRARLSPQQEPLDPATPQEILESYKRARAMLEPDSADLPLLLRKPLDDGGVRHGGRDAFGRNVYASRREPNYRILERWAQGAATGDER